MATVLMITAGPSSAFSGEQASGSFEGNAESQPPKKEQGFTILSRNDACL
jgi:hypothetical protein